MSLDFNFGDWVEYTGKHHRALRNGDTGIVVNLNNWPAYYGVAFALPNADCVLFFMQSEKLKLHKKSEVTSVPPIKLNL